MVIRVHIARVSAGPLIDAHVHLQNLGGELEGMLQRAAGQGIERFICNGTSESDWPLVAALARQHRQVVPCFGLHPWHADGASPHWLETLQGFLGAMPSAVGEIGLDRCIRSPAMETQAALFKVQIRLAKVLNRPIMVHCVRAWDGLLRAFAEEPPPSSGTLVHAYAGSVSLVKTLSQKYDAFFSLAGNVLGHGSPARHQTLRAIPKNRLLLETDAPDLAVPSEFRLFPGPAGKPGNEPANLRCMTAGIASVLGMSESELAALAWDNGQYFLSRWGLA
jgi:TatD DNase family protein